MKLSEIAHLKFILKLRFKSLQLRDIACWYDQIVYVENCH